MNNKVKFEKNIAIYSILQRNAVIYIKIKYIYIYMYIYIYIYIYSKRKEFNIALLLHMFHILMTSSI